jgi:hypothetical protein
VLRATGQLTGLGSIPLHVEAERGGHGGKQWMEGKRGADRVRQHTTRLSSVKLQTLLSSKQQNRHSHGCQSVGPWHPSQLQRNRALLPAGLILCRLRVACHRIASVPSSCTRCCCCRWCQSPWAPWCGAWCKSLVQAHRHPMGSLPYPQQQQQQHSSHATSTAQHTMPGGSR